MEQDKYNKLVERFGKVKADKIVAAIAFGKLQNEAREKRREEKQVERILKMLPKIDLISGAYYNGYRERGAHVAMWDGVADEFKAINYTMGTFFVERLPYFSDVAETNLDGFMPFELVKQIDL